jgi:anti-anti-sigma factor
MPSISSSVQDRTVTITIGGDFTFDLNQAFRESYKAHPGTMSFVLDLSRAGYMDSAGLGMLLQLREYAGADAARITLKGPNPTLRQILDIANFGKLFRIVD